MAHCRLSFACRSLCCSWRYNSIYLRLTLANQYISVYIFLIKAINFLIIKIKSEHIYADNIRLKIKNIQHKYTHIYIPLSSENHFTYSANIRASLFIFITPKVLQILFPSYLVDIQLRFSRKSPIYLKTT